MIKVKKCFGIELQNIGCSNCKEKGQFKLVNEIRSHYGFIW